MKYFALSATLAIGTTAAQSTALATAPTYDDDLCFGQSAEEYIQNAIAEANGGDAGKVNNYQIRYKDINNGGSLFVTISCKFAPWQDNGNVYKPYELEAWNRTEATNYNQYQADRDAMKQWIRNNDGTEKWPAKAGGRYRCGNRNNAAGERVREWHMIKAIMVCPDFDTVGATVDWAAPEVLQDPQGGCFVDTGDDRDLPLGFLFDNDVPDAQEYCLNYCKDEGYYYASLQAAGWCHCGNSFGKHGQVDDSECTMVCWDAGSGKICGDSWRNNIYLSGYEDDKYVMP